MGSSFLRPARLVLAVLLVNLLLGVAATWVAMQEPWLGLDLQAGAAADEVRIVAAAPTLPDLRGARLLGIEGERDSFVLRPGDLLEEPDTLDTYPEMATFFARQQEIHDLLQHEVRLHLISREGEAQSLVVVPTPRPLASLYPVFWFQLAVGMLGCLIGAWIFFLRPADWSARMFALTGFSFPVFAMSAAVYSSRALTLPGNFFRILASLNHFGALMFGCALVGLFLCYPRPLVQPRRLIVLPILFGLWFLADAFRLAADQNWGARFPILLQMIASIVLGLVQWRRNRGDPLRRAALRWLLLASSVGCGLFVFTTAGSQFLGWLPPLAQGYSFGFFLLMHGGLALGVGRYRLFELDTWAYRILLWVAGASAVVVGDTLLVAALGMAPDIALGLTLLLCGGLYFPFRQWLWQRLTAHSETRIEELMPEIVAIAFLATPSSRMAGWRKLLQQLYHPLKVEAGSEDGSRASISDNGLRLNVPACAGLHALSLEFRDQGRRLFSLRDAAFVESLRDLMARAAATRDAYEQGVDEERRRIARDMHDDVGARLLMLIHRARGDEEADIARAAMGDLRTAIASLETRAKSLNDALADWRNEIAERCEGAGVSLRWKGPAPDQERDLSARQSSALERILREAVTNALKHARPDAIAITVGLSEEALSLVIEDDGRHGTPTATWQSGRGVRNMRQRLADLTGTLSISDSDMGGARLHAILPLGNC